MSRPPELFVTLPPAHAGVPELPDADHGGPGGGADQWVRPALAGGGGLLQRSGPVGQADDPVDPRRPIRDHDLPVAQLAQAVEVNGAPDDGSRLYWSVPLHQCSAGVVVNSGTDCCNRPRHSV